MVTLISLSGNYAALAMVKVDLKTAVPQLIHGLDSPDADIRQVERLCFSFGWRKCCAVSGKTRKMR